MRGVLPSIHSIEGELTSDAADESNGRAFLGIIPGSLLDVRRRKLKSYIIQIYNVVCYGEISSNFIQ